MYSDICYDAGCELARVALLSALRKSASSDGEAVLSCGRKLQELLDHEAPMDLLLELQFQDFNSYNPTCLHIP